MALVVVVATTAAGCGDSAGPAGTPAGLMVAGGQNAAFPGDTFPLTTWFTDTGGLPLGVRPPGVGWTSSDTTVVAQVGDSLFVARALGSCVLTAAVAVEGVTFTAPLEFHVIPPLTGRMAWVRQNAMTGPVRLVSRDLATRTVVPAPSVGYPTVGQGPPAVSPDGRYVAIQATRPTSDAADVAVYLVDLVMNSAAGLTDSMLGNQIAPRWTPDGGTVLFSADAGGSWNIWSVPASGGEPELRVRLDAGSPVFFDVSRPDGRLVVALATAQGGYDLWEASLDTGVIGRITNTPQEGKAPPRVSPNGSTIAYTGYVDSAGGFGPFLMPRGGGGARELLPPVLVPGYGSGPARARGAPAVADAWSVDGGFVLVYWMVDATAIYATAEVQQILYPGDIYAVSLDGLLRVRLTTWQWGDVQGDVR